MNNPKHKLSIRQMIDVSGISVNTIRKWLAKKPVHPAIAHHLASSIGDGALPFKSPKHKKNITPALDKPYHI